MSEVPVIDLASADGDATLARIEAACREWGFFQVRGHGLPRELGARVMTEMQRFFAEPTATKREIERTAANAWGFYDRELTKNRRDWKEIFDVGREIDDGALAGNRPQWPSRLPGFRETVLEFFAACETVGVRLLAAIERILETPTGELVREFGARQTSFLRLNYYPRCADPAPSDAPFHPTTGHLGIHHHTDSGALTVLLQDDVPGLQVLHDGRWHLVEPRPDALVINIGDVVQVWSNDRFPAPVHRVLANSARERYSAPFFLNPAPETVYAPLAAVSREGARYRPICWGEFRAARAAGDYADVGEEIQISRYRI